MVTVMIENTYFKANQQVWLGAKPAQLAGSASLRRRVKYYFLHFKLQVIPTFLESQIIFMFDKNYIENIINIYSTK